MTKYRTGRSLGRTVYRQIGDEPDKGDELIGMMETRAAASQVVDALNWLPDPAKPLEEDIRAAINRNSAENSSNTPDHLLAEFLVACLDAFNMATRQRDVWYGVQLAPGRNLQRKPEDKDLG